MKGIMKRENDEALQEWAREVRQKSMGIAVHITYEGYMYKSKEVAEYYHKLRMRNLINWRTKLAGNNKYTPHQGKRECARRMTS